MKSTSVAGILLLVLGALVLAYQGMVYLRRQKILDVGPFDATQDTQQDFPVSPILDGLGLVGWLALLMVGARGKA